MFLINQSTEHLQNPVQSWHIEQDVSDEPCEKRFGSEFRRVEYLVCLVSGIVVTVLLAWRESVRNKIYTHMSCYIPSFNVRILMRGMILFV